MKTLITFLFALMLTLGGTVLANEHFVTDKAGNPVLDRAGNPVEFGPLPDCVDVVDPVLVHCADKMTDSDEEGDDPDEEE
ncbi:MAG: hypothetical protein ACE5HV_00210 [Acidobacteriota bacterium]